MRRFVLFQSDTKSVFYNAASVTSLTQLSEFTSLSLQWPGRQNSARGVFVLTQLRTMRLRCLLIMLIQTEICRLLQQIWVTDQFRMKLSDSFAACWWQDWIQIQRGYKKGEMRFVFIGWVRNVGLFSFPQGKIHQTQSKWNLEQESHE